MLCLHSRNNRPGRLDHHQPEPAIDAGSEPLSGKESVVMAGMPLKLTRKQGQSIVIGEDISITIDRISGDRAELSILAPRGLRVDRKEVRDRMELERNN